MQNRIKTLRQAKGWPMQRLADEVGTNKSQISKLEKGERRLSQQWMERLAAVLGCTPADLLPGHGKQRRASGTMSITIDSTVDSGMGGHVEKVDEDKRYFVTFKPPQQLSDAEFFGVIMEGNHHAAYPDGSELIFARTMFDTRIENGKFVLIEEEKEDGQTQRYMGQVEISPRMISINFQGRDNQHHHRTIYWENAQSSQAFNDNSSDTSYLQSSHPLLEQSLPSVPMSNGNTRILGVLVKSIRNE